MGQTLIIKTDNKDVFFGKLDTKIEKYYNCDGKSKMFRACRKFNLPLMSMFFGEWKKDIEKYDTVILFDNGYSTAVSNCIKRKNKNCRVILWFWNPITPYFEKFLNDKGLDEIWTYSKKDAQKYNLKYNTQFYSYKAGENMPKNAEIEYDVSFLGRAKSRERQILDLEEELKKENVNTEFRIIRDEKDLMTYDEYLEMVSKSKCILDFYPEGIEGLSLRALESIFLKKKLITNNKDIMTYDFYRPTNMFIVGVDDMSKVKEFVDSDYEEIDEKIVKYYDFYSWLDRIVK